ncbi:glycosyltransferase family 2 protein [Flavicella sediminum]|uniref:glycosyltransferase family 2 protein n=1 Tax=Flavicella sediminum TaxID=2585141 RepID=UPI00111FCE8D|nr:glycosyltransferase [Flavicella sediminum]
MKFSLIICTYQRPQAILKLLKSVEKQELYPDEILVVDGSLNEETQDILQAHSFKNLVYYKVSDTDRGLTKQRNFGISKVAMAMEIVCFLDDDIVLETFYFKELIHTYKIHPEAGGVGGYITNEVHWDTLEKDRNLGFDDFVLDGSIRKLGSRNVLRKKLNLLPNTVPCFMPEFSNGFSVSFLPPNGKIYAVEYFMGGVSSYRKEVVQKIKFSTYFEGYGLYEDMDYCLRVSSKYKLFVNTAAQLMHYHEAGGRPNKFSYGKMVVRNGWYVWRVKFPKPKFKARVKWNFILLLLTFIRLSNVLTTANKKEALTESLGRIAGLLSLIFNKPKVQ